MTDDIEVDARDLLCPLPVLKLRKAFTRVPAGSVASLLATDPAAFVDVPHFCAENGHELISTTEDGGVAIYRVRKV